MATTDDIDPDMAPIHAQTARIYDREARGYDARRSKVLFEQAWLDRFLDKLPPKPDVLDLGCGAGDPVSRYLLTKNCTLTSMDIAPGMLAIARERFPDAEWLQGDMRKLSLDRRFDGILSWNGFFHLSRREQVDTIPKLAAHVRPGGALMLTIGHGDGEVTGTVEGHTVYNASLAITVYRDLLGRLGFRAIDHVLEDPTCNLHSVILASDLTSPE